MSDERHRNRHRDRADHPTEGMDPDRLRYFTQPVDGRPHTRHRRRRTGTADTPSGSWPAAPASPDDRLPGPGTAPQTSAPQTSAPQTPAPQAPAQRPAADTTPSAPQPTLRSRAQRSDPGTAPIPVSQPAQPQRTEPPRTEPPRAEPRRAEPPRAQPERIEPDVPSAPAATGRSVVGGRSSQRRRDSGVAPGALAAPTLTGSQADARVADHPDTDSLDVHARVDHDLTEPHDLVEPADDTVVSPLADDAVVSPPADDTVLASVPDDSHPDLDDHPERRPAAVARRRRRRIGMAVVAVVMLALVAGVGYWGADKAGLFDSRKDYSNAAGTADVLVHVPANASIKQIGGILVDDNVVGSVRAFVDAADGASLSSGYYKLRTQIPAAEAVKMITDADSTNRVGRIVIPPGTPLDTKRDTSGRVTPGIFAMIADQTGVEINGQRLGVTEQQLSDAAANASITELGVPSWAQESVTALNGDHRRIEGLIAPVTWEDVDPHDNATQILNTLITRSAAMDEGWGLVSNNKSGLSPYQTLVAASLLQGEVQPDDYPKVARVILNRLAKGQRLEFDSTANYTASVVDLNLHDDALKADTPWNTYVRQGLPPTPIGAVAEPSVEAMEQPADGDWLYFVTVDSKGTTLFTDDFDQHRRNIATACQNKFITCR